MYKPTWPCGHHHGRSHRNACEAGRSKFYPSKVHNSNFRINQHDLSAIIMDECHRNDCEADVPSLYQQVRKHNFRIKMKVSQWGKAAMLVIAGIMLTSPAAVSAAEIWSQPTYTEQWSTPTYTEQWSEPTHTEQWSEPTHTEQWSEPTYTEPENTKTWAEEWLEFLGSIDPGATQPAKPSLYIQLQINSNHGLIGDQPIVLDVPPVVMNERTMVPLRFLADTIQAELEWEGTERKITLSLGDKTIILKVDDPIAMVNGQRVELDVPPVIKDERTLVPLRFITENFDFELTYIADTQTIELRSGDAILQHEQSQSGSIAANTDELNYDLLDFSKLYGTWKIWTESTVTEYYYKDTGNYATHELSGGSDAGFVTINEDGTYAMNLAVWGKAEGEWRLAFPGELNGERSIQAIVLKDGAGGSDWAVAPTHNGKFRLYNSLGIENTWVGTNEIYRD